MITTPLIQDRDIFFVPFAKFNVLSNASNCFVLRVFNVLPPHIRVCNNVYIFEKQLEDLLIDVLYCNFYDDHTDFCQSK